MFLELFDIELFIFKRNNFSEFQFLSKKMLVANFMRFRRKRLEKPTRIDNYLYFFIYFFTFEKKNSVNFRKKKIEKNFENNF